jgi:PPOX class probable F420-dependent enzyme
MGRGDAGGDPAVMDTTTLAGARMRRFLEREPVVWLSTVRPNGAPHIVPIWFWWDGEAILVFSKPDAQKVRNLRDRPRAMLALGDAEDDFDVGLIEGHAELLDRPTSEVLPPAHLAKYASQLDAIGLTADEYAATYSQVVRIILDRPLGWHGRRVPRSARLAGAPSRSIDESPRERPTLREWLGEPLARGIRAVADGVRVAVPRPAAS